MSTPKPPTRQIFSLRTNNDLGAAQLVDPALTAQEFGFDQLWVSNDLYLRSAPVLMGMLAARTSRLELGVAVMNPYSVHPVELAMTASTMQEITGGRFRLGLGAGSAEFLGWAGIDRARPLATTRQAVAALRTLLGHRDVDPADLPDWARPVRPLGIAVEVPVPVYVGAMGPRMLRMSGACADGALPLLYPPEHFPAARAQVHEGLAASGRDPSRFDLPACFWVSVGPDRDAARSALGNKLAYYGPSISAPLLAESGLRPADFEAAAELAHQGSDAMDLVDERMLALGIAGDPSEVVARCRGLQRMGGTHLSFGPPLGSDPVAAVRLLGEQVLPQLREGGGD